MQNLSSFTPNFKCHSTAKLCALTFCTFFPLDGFEVLKQKFEERGKVLSALIDKVMT
jgi:Zn-finger protein